MRQKTYFLVVLVLIFVSTPFPAVAYGVSEVFAKMIAPNRALFVVEYKFGFLNRDFMTPLDADRSSERRGADVGYELIGSDGKVVREGRVSAVILSQAEMRDRHYLLPAKKNGEFMLVAFVDTTGITQDVRLSVTRLPFTLVDRGIKIEAAVPNTELTNYQTSLIAPYW